MRITEIVLLDRLLLIGAPGIGKTERIRQLAEEEAKKMKRIFVDVRELTDEQRDDIVSSPHKYYLYMRIVATHMFPEDIQFPVKMERTGFPFIRFYAPEDIALFTLPDIAGVIFLDEITNVTREDQLAMYYSFVLEKELGWNIRISKKVKIISAGNPPEYSYIVNPPPHAFLSRFWKIEVSPPSIEEWYEYMEKYYAEKWDKRTYLYLKIFPHDFLGTPEQLKSFENFPCPRSWTEVAVHLKELDEQVAKLEVIYEYIQGKLGKEVGSKFASFIKKGIRKPEEVISNPSILGSIADPEVKYLTLWALSQKPELLLNKGKPLMRYLKMNERDLLVLLVLLMEKKERKKIIAQNTDIFVDIIREIARYV